MTIILAGASGDLGSRILDRLVAIGADVRCLVRSSTSADAIESLRRRGAVQVVAIDNRVDSMADAMQGGSVVVSAVSGLRPVIVDYQSRLLQAATVAGVERFIPSDYAIDYRSIPSGANRNLNLREEFRVIADQQSRVRVTSILNGAFSDLLTGVAPFVLFRINRVLCWGDPTQLMDWTTIDDTAAYTAHAAMDPSSPRYLRIAGDQLSAEGLCQVMSNITGRQHRVLRPAGLKVLEKLIALTRFFVPGGDAVYPPWQGMQYMHNMYSGYAKFETVDNARYPVRFTRVEELLRAYLNGERQAYQLR